jgi:tetratricopeptide (TPR) repeat protein
VCSSDLPASWEKPAEQAKDPATPGVTVIGGGSVSGLGGVAARRPALVSNVSGGMTGNANLASRSGQLALNDPASDARLPAGGAELTLLTNPSAPTRVQVSADGKTLELESHLAAHQLLGVVLHGRPAESLRSAATSDLRRALGLRARQTYALGSVTPERQAAAWNLLTELALLEGRPQAARQAAERALRALDQPGAAYAAGTPRLCHLLAALSAEMNFDFAPAAAHYRPLLAGWTLPPRNMTAIFDTLLSVMVQAGDCSGAIEVLKSKWNGQPSGDATRYRELGRLYLSQDQVEEAIRAFSSMAEFIPNLATTCNSPQDFLKLK